MNKPNFFIIGFPKCGTTAVASYLAKHPNVLMSKHKEPHYFASDFICPVVRRVTTEKEYLDMFSDEHQEYKAIGEASTGYIYSSVAVDNILQYAEDPKFIVIVRNPLDMVLSAHAQMLKSGHEDVGNFSEAWRLSPLRKRGICLPNKKMELYHILYQDFGRIGSLLESVMQKIRPERLKIIVFDDMLIDMRSVYLDILDFLGLENDGQIEFERKNERRFHRFKLIGGFVNNPPKILMITNNKVKKVLGVERIGFIKALRKWNLVKQDRLRPLDNKLVEEISKHYRPEVEIVERILQRKLGWLSDAE